jgi:hypothetical protein
MRRDFELYRAFDVRERRTFEKRKGKIFSFRIQMEVFSNDKWREVKRWDSSHGFVDCDTYNLQGEKKKVIFDVSLEEGLVLAQDDFNSNWKHYQERFLKGLFP